MKVAVLYSSTEHGKLFVYSGVVPDVTSAIDCLNSEAAKLGFTPWIKEVETHPASVDYLENNYTDYSASLAL